MGDDLEVLPEEALKKRSFGASGLDGPGSGRRACARGQANIALSSHRVAHQKCGVSRRWCNARGSGWGRNVLRLRLGDRAECTSEYESGCEESTNSRSLFRSLTKVVV